jgi:transposase InsO family protein
MIDGLSPRDIVSIFALSRDISAHYKVTSIDELSKKLEVSLSTEWRNRETIIERLAEKPQRVVTPRKDEFALDAEKVVQHLMKVTHAIQPNNVSPTYAPWFLSAMKDLHSEGISNTNLAKLTGILRTSLARQRDLSDIVQRRDLTEQELEIEKIWHNSPHRRRNTLQKFYDYYVKISGDHVLKRQELRKILLRLGLRNPRGPKPKNEGVDTKLRWEPHALWAGDGKIVKIIINGKKHEFLWYAFADEATTLLVGTVLSDTESAKEVIAALESGATNVGRRSIGIVIDNRTVRDDLGSLREYCSKHNIEIVRTFPGNPKSNGIIEGNFSIFENHVSEIKIQGSNDADIARSIAKEVVEIFTQLRNQKVRKNKGTRVKNDDPLDAENPDTRSAIQKLAARFEVTGSSFERKWALIEAARQKFINLSEDREGRLRIFVGRATDEELVEAQAAYLAQCAKHPEKNYDHRYFAAIIRNKRDEIAKAAHVEAFAAGCKRQIELPKEDLSDSAMAEALSNTIADICQIKTPLRRRLFLEQFVFFIIILGGTERFHRVWAATLVNLTRNRQVSLSFQQQVIEFLYERIGPKLLTELKLDFPVHVYQKIQSTAPPMRESYI